MSFGDQNLEKNIVFSVQFTFHFPNYRYWSDVNPIELEIPYLTQREKSTFGLVYYGTKLWDQSFLKKI